MIFAQDLACFAILWSHLLLCLFELRNVPSGKFLHRSRLCKRCLVTLHATGFMSKTLLSLAQQPGPYKSFLPCTFIIVPICNCLGSIPLSSTTKPKLGKVWMAIWENSKNLNFLNLLQVLKSVYLLVFSECSFLNLCWNSLISWTLTPRFPTLPYVCVLI